MIAFAAERLMELEVDALTGASRAVNFGWVFSLTAAEVFDPMKRVQVAS